MTSYAMTLVMRKVNLPNKYTDRLVFVVWPMFFVRNGGRQFLNKRNGMQNKSFRSPIMLVPISYRSMFHLLHTLNASGWRASDGEMVNAGDRGSEHPDAGLCLLVCSQNLYFSRCLACSWKMVDYCC